MIILLHQKQCLPEWCPVIFVPILPPPGVIVIRSMPIMDNDTSIKMRVEYGMIWMKYAATNFIVKDGITLARSTTLFGTIGPTRSRAAETVITNKIILMVPKHQKPLVAIP